MQKPTEYLTEPNCFPDIKELMEALMLTRRHLQRRSPSLIRLTNYGWYISRGSAITDGIALAKGTAY
jgi:hypothetical protein